MQSSRSSSTVNAKTRSGGNDHAQPAQPQAPGNSERRSSEANRKQEQVIEISPVARTASR